MYKVLTRLFFALVTLPLMGQTVAGGSSDVVLTNAADVLSLSAEQAASGIKISIKGVVTAAEPNWGGRFFVQDASGGVFVENISDVQPAPGDVIAVSGVSYPGGYAPIISKPRWEKLGTAPLPAAKRVAIEQLMSGDEDGQRIEISGIVRRAQMTNAQLEVELASGGYRVHVYAPVLPGIDPQTLIGSEVRIRGTPAVSYNATLRHLVTVAVYVPLQSDFIVKESSAKDPFKEPLTPASNIAQYRAGRTLGDRVHVKGIVTCQRRGEDVFIRDASGGLEIKSTQTLALYPGDVIEAVGFPGIENFLPVLEDAIFRKMPEPRTKVLPVNTPISELLAGLHHADFITLEGKLLDCLPKNNQTSAGDSGMAKTVLVIQNTNLLFTAEAETTGLNPIIASIPIGSIVKVSGICFLQSDENGKIKSLQILLPTADSVRIVKKPSWLTPQHLLITLAAALVAILVASSWIIMVSRKNATLRQLVRQRELDQKELQKAHDTLEWRVKERTQQLKFQITARKESELQFKATLTERTRLAKELHDTLEQMLTGITLQLNTVAKLFRQDPDTASHHLGLVRNLMRMCRVDLRRSIWNLRSRELEKFDLAKALLTSGNQIADSAGVRVEVETKGQICPLPEIVEENLLRIGQEAVTNTVKHSGANRAKITLEFGAQNIVLEIKDDGNGFTPENCVGPEDGHFGLLGMTERVKRLDGKISINSAPGQGTILRVELPIKQTLTSKLVNEQTINEESIADPNPDR